jgi:hypothetical protein
MPRVTIRHSLSPFQGGLLKESVDANTLGDALPYLEKRHKLRFNPLPDKHFQVKHRSLLARLLNLLGRLLRPGHWTPPPHDWHIRRHDETLCPKQQLNFQLQEGDELFNAHEGMKC